MKTLDLSIDINQIDDSFARIAEQLMNHYILVSGESRYRLCEIEFYYTQKGTDHEDKYTHCHDLQKTTGQWYQHGSGLDITIGNKLTCGGILIRALQEIDKDGVEIHKQYFYGPLKSLQVLMSSFTSIEKHQVVFGLEEFEFKNKQKILNAPRAGLNPTLDPEMYSKPYRYFIFPKKEHKPKGEIISSLRGLIKEEELKELFGWKTLPEKKY